MISRRSPQKTGLRIVPATKYFRSIMKFSITVRNADPGYGYKYFSVGGLRLEKHPDKTFIGRIEKGFDFLGYHFSPEGLSMAEKTIEKFLARADRLYEQEPGGGVCPLPACKVRAAMDQVVVWRHNTPYKGG